MDAPDPTPGPLLPEAVVRYAGHGDGLVDVHVPRGDGPHPLVVLVHGGFWKQDWDRLHQRPMARALVEAGCVVAAVEYRRVGPGGAGGWPTTALDVAAAVTALPGLLDGLGVATTTTTLVGHSAGGHLVLWLAARGHDELDRRIRVVSLAGVSDLRAAAADRLGDGAAQALLGGEPDDVPRHYVAADPMTLLGPDTTERILLVHGVDDDVVPASQSRALAAAHPGIKLHEIAGVGHMELVEPGSVAWPVVLAAILG